MNVFGRKVSSRTLLLSAVLVLCTVTAGSADIGTQSIIRASTSASGGQANGTSYASGAFLSADGRYVAFHSLASNLVPGDTNAAGDYFRKDTQSGAITRVSTTASGGQANGGPGVSPELALSPDGRYIAFTSAATNLITEDTNLTDDVFVKDIQTGAITRVSESATGDAGNRMSWLPNLSADGRYVAFSSMASNLVTDDTNGAEDVFLKDTQTGAVTRISSSADGGQGNNYSRSTNSSLSANGRYIAFWSSATNLVTPDTDGKPDVFLKDAQTGTITMVSTTASGEQGNDRSSESALSADGRYVAFTSYAWNFISGDVASGVGEIFVKDTQTGAITRASESATGDAAELSSNFPELSADGRYVVFSSFASNLIPGDTFIWRKIFKKDMQTGAITLLSPATGNSSFWGCCTSHLPAISSDGRVVAFASDGPDLVAGDTNRTYDIFVVRGAIIAVSVYPARGEEGDWYSQPPTISLSRQGDGAGTVQYQWNSTSAGGWTTFASPLLPAAGINALHYRSLNSTGDTEYQGQRTFKVDQVPPVITVVKPSSYLSTWLSRTTTIPVIWGAIGDQGSGIPDYDVQVKTGSGGNWTQLFYYYGHTSTVFTGVPGNTYYFRARAMDITGNQGDYGQTQWVTFPKDDAAAAYSRGWYATNNPSGPHYLGTSRYTTGRGKYFTYNFKGSALWLVIPKGKPFGAADVYVDGKWKRIVNAYATTYASRRVVFIGYTDPTKWHTVKVVNKATAGHPRFEIDGIAYKN